MDNSIFAEIIKPIDELLSKNGFTQKEQGCFEGESAIYKVYFDEARKQFVLSFKDKSNELDDFGELASWLFDGGVKSDAVVIAEDFCDVISKKLGIVKSNKTNDAANIAMPTKAAAGEENGINSLTQKLLAIYPAFKNDYKEAYAKYNSFLYID